MPRRTKKTTMLTPIRTSPRNASRRSTYEMKPTGRPCERTVRCELTRTTARESFLPQGREVETLVRGVVVEALHRGPEHVRIERRLAIRGGADPDPDHVVVDHLHQLGDELGPSLRLEALKLLRVEIVGLGVVVGVRPRPEPGSGPVSAEPGIRICGEREAA